MGTISSVRSSSAAPACGSREQVIGDVEQRRGRRRLVAVHLRPEQHAPLPGAHGEEMDGAPLDGAADLLEPDAAGVLRGQGLEARDQIGMPEAPRRGVDETRARPGVPQRLRRRRGGGDGDGNEGEGGEDHERASWDDRPRSRQADQDASAASDGGGRAAALQRAAHVGRKVTGRRPPARWGPGRPPARPPPIAAGAPRAGGAARPRRPRTTRTNAISRVYSTLARSPAARSMAHRSAAGRSPSRRPASVSSRARARRTAVRGGEAVDELEDERDARETRAAGAGERLRVGDETRMPRQREGEGVQRAPADAVRTLPGSDTYRLPTSIRSWSRSSRSGSRRRCGS